MTPQKIQKTLSRVTLQAWSLALLMTMVSVGRAAVFEKTDSAAEKQRKLLNVLKSDAPAAEKAITCKYLAIYGTKEAVPALAELLPDGRFASWARIALEAIPDPAADKALRGALEKLHANLLIGVINSIGVRRDPKAAKLLEKKLQDTDPAVASAAAAALGRIGGTQVAKALTRSLTRAPAAVRPSVAEGCVLCAERFLAEGRLANAVKLYDSVRKADVPKQKILEATRGAILARQSAGLPLLLEQLRSSDKALLGIGLRTARELPGSNITRALAAELDRSSPDHQAFLLLALADRNDAAVLPVILKAAGGGPKKLRLVALGVLDRRGDVSTVPVLLDAAASGDEDLAQAALTALARLPGNQVDADVLASLPKSSGKMRWALVELATQRRIEKALPAIVRSAEDTDAGVRSASVQAIGVLGTDKEAADLVRVLSKTQSPKERADIEMALISVSSRSGATCVPRLLPLAQSSDSALRTIALHALASAGGPDALAAVKSALNDQDEIVQDEAVRTLSTWPNNWPEDSAVAEPLLMLARSDQKTSHQVLGLRGYLQYLKADKQLKDDDKVAKLNELMPALKRPEEKRLAIAVIDAIPTAGTLELLSAFAAEPAIADDACSVIVKLAGKDLKTLSREQRQQALQTVVEKSQNDKTKKGAEELLKKL